MKKAIATLAAAALLALAPATAANASQWYDGPTGTRNAPAVPCNVFSTAVKHGHHVVVTKATCPASSPSTLSQYRDIDWD